MSRLLVVGTAAVGPELSSSGTSTGSWHPQPLPQGVPVCRLSDGGVRISATSAGDDVVSIVYDPIDPYIDPLLELLDRVGAGQRLPPPPALADEVFRCDDCGVHVESALLLIDHIAWTHL